MKLSTELPKLLRSIAVGAREVEVSGIEEKARLDYVSDVDRKLDEQITRGLERLTPGVPVLSEERPIRPETIADAFWMIDPLDGTHNFIAGVPMSAVSVALVDGAGTVLGGVADIATGAVYFAEREGGASVDGQPLALSPSPSTLLAVSSGALDALMKRPAAYQALRELGKLRNFGSQALQLCYVAEGRVGLALSAEARLWDDAAGRLIATEAGASYVSLAAPPGGVAAEIAASASAPLRSVCAHPSIFSTARDLAASVFAEEH